MIKNNSNKKLKVNFKIRTFLIFLGLSILFWTLIKFSKTYTSTIRFDVKYTNLPKNKVLQNKPIDKVDAMVASSGFNLLSYKLTPPKLKFDIHQPIHKRRKQYYYLPNNHLSDLKSQLDIETSIIKVFQDTIPLVLGKNTTKKVPVKLDADIQFKLGYNFASDIEITPKNIKITGPKSQLDTINNIKTAQLKLLDVSKDIQQKVALELLENKNIQFSNSDVLVTIKVDKFTEGSLVVPFKILHAPANYRISTFPTEVKVVYQVGLLNFNKITPQSVQVVCDFKESKENGLNYLIPRLKEKSALITSARIVPDKIEFLIEERK